MGFSVLPKDFVVSTNARLRRLEENSGALSVELTPDDLRDIDESAARITVAGARYPERLERMTGR